MVITENDIKELKSILLTEGVETKNMKSAKHYLYDKMGYNEQQAMQCIGQIKTDIPNSRLGKCKFMLAMVRMFVDGEFQDGQTVMNVNKCLKYAASEAHINEYDQNLNGFTSQQFIEKFAGSAQQDLEQDKQDVSAQQYDEQNSQYEIVKITSFEEAEEYGEYVDWCVTHYDDMFDSYTNNGNGVFYFCLRNGWQNEQEEKGENCPLDSYGLSMIAVSVNNDGSCNTITCRWNHENGGNDNIMTPKELSQIIGRNFYQVFKPLTSQEIQRNMAMKIYEIQEEIESASWGGERIEDIAEKLEYDPDYGDTDERDLFKYRTEKGNFVLLYDDGEFVIEQIFDAIHFRLADIIEVESGDKHNFVNTNGDLLSDTWFDKAQNDFNYGFAKVCKGKKWNLINKKGEFVLPEWFDAIGGRGFDVHVDEKEEGYRGFIEVQKDKKINFLYRTV